MVVPVRLLPGRVRPHGKPTKKLVQCHHLKSQLLGRLRQEDWDRVGLCLKYHPPHTHADMRYAETDP